MQYSHWSAGACSQTAWVEPDDVHANGVVGNLKRKIFEWRTSHPLCSQRWPHRESKGKPMEEVRAMRDEILAECNRCFVKTVSESQDDEQHENWSVSCCKQVMRAESLGAVISSFE